MLIVNDGRFVLIDADGKILGRNDSCCKLKHYFYDKGLLVDIEEDYSPLYLNRNNGTLITYKQIVQRYKPLDYKESWISYFSKHFTEEGGRLTEVLPSESIMNIRHLEGILKAHSIPYFILNGQLYVDSMESNTRIFDKVFNVTHYTKDQIYEWLGY